MPIKPEAAKSNNYSDKKPPLEMSLITKPHDLKNKFSS